MVDRKLKAAITSEGLTIKETLERYNAENPDDPKPFNVANFRNMLSKGRARCSDVQKVLSVIGYHFAILNGGRLIPGEKVIQILSIDFIFNEIEAALAVLGYDIVFLKD